MRIARWVGAGAGAATIACNAIAGLDADFSLAGTTPAPDVATIDGADASSNDGGAVDAAPSSFCAAQGPDVVFCDDFETAQPAPTFGWDDVELDPPSASVTRLAGVGVGGSAGIRAYAGEASVSRKADLWKTIGPPGASRYELELDFRIVEKSIGYAVVGVLAFRQASGNQLPYYGPASYGTTAAVIDCSDPPKPASGVTVPEALGTWHHARITLMRTEDAETYASTLTVDGVVVDDGTPLAVMRPTPQAVDVRVGVLFGDTGSGVVEVHFDNVVARSF